MRRWRSRRRPRVLETTGCFSWGWSSGFGRGRPSGLRNKLIRNYEVIDAAVHDSRVLDELLDKGNTCKDVFADSAYRSAEIEQKLTARGSRSRICVRGICVRGRRGRPLSEAAQAANRTKSLIRWRIEHVFGAQQTASGGRLVRTIGIVRARARIRLQNQAYNTRRLVTLDRMAPA